MNCELNILTSYVIYQLMTEKYVQNRASCYAKNPLPTVKSELSKAIHYARKFVMHGLLIAKTYEKHRMRIAKPAMQKETSLPLRLLKLETLQHLIGRRWLPNLQKLSRQQILIGTRKPRPEIH